MSAERPPEPLLPGYSGHVSHVISGHVSHVISGHVSQVIIVSSHNHIVTRPWRRGAQHSRAGREYCSVVTGDVSAAVVVAC